VADESSPSNPRPFDVRTVKYLVALMSRHDLSEIDLREGDQRIRLQRGPRGTIVSAGPPSLIAAPPAAPVSAPAEAPKPASNLVEIKSEAIGVFYSRPDPKADPYVRVGSRVSAESVVGLVMAMKLQTEVAAGCSGVIREILVENEQPIEYGQVLFRVDPTG
jgi:acetyl-CoA carboxylase biotin carboxyl carrier protein